MFRSMFGFFSDRSKSAPASASRSSEKPSLSAVRSNSSSASSSAPAAAASCAAAHGAVVCSVDFCQNRLDMALELGARHVYNRSQYSAEEIAEWCRCHGDCDTCNHMQIDNEGDGECDLEIYGDEPCCWSSHVIATLDRIMTFESQADTVVEDTENDK